VRILSTGILLLTGLMLGAGPAGAQKRQRDLITREEIVKLDGAQTAYDVVRRIHPEWLRVTGVRSLSSGSGGVQVYLNERKEGSAAALRNIDVGAIGEIQHLDGPEAEARFGQNHTAGAILVILFSGTRKDSLPPVKPLEKT
jgi:hypothetical protein